MQEGGEHVYDALVKGGIEVLFGLPGVQTLPLDRVVAEREEIRYVMARHETAVPHMAWGYYETSGTLAATLTIGGPGDTNAMHGLKNALNDCVPLVHMAVDVNPDQRGKEAVHEIAHDTFDNVVKENVAVTHPLMLRQAVERAIETALTPPFGPVRISLPSGFLATEVAVPAAAVTPERVSYETADAVERGADLLVDAERPVVYVGGGARRSPDGPQVVRKLVAELDAPVLATYKGKGVFPEDEPQYVAITAGEMPAGAVRLLERADVVLALGTNFDGPTTQNWSLPMGESLVHVNIDAGAIDTGYEADVTVVGDVGEVGEQLFTHLTSATQAESWDGSDVATAVREEYVEHLRGVGAMSNETPAPSAAVLTAIRDVLPQEAVVTTDIGTSRNWARQVFEAYDRRMFVTEGSWAGMGVGFPSALGATVANPDRPVVCLTGDGGLMMCVHELHTAAEEGLDVVVVVLNNRDYGSVSQAPQLAEYTDEQPFRWRTDPSFVAVAEAFGCRATAVDSAPGAAEAVSGALDHDAGPELVEVAIDPDELSVTEAADYEVSVEFD